MRAEPGGGEVISMSGYVESRVMAPPAGTDSHVDLAALLAHGRDGIDGVAGEPIREHCRACPSCGKQLAMLLLVLEIRDLRISRRRRALGALAATFVFAVAMVAAVVSGGLRLPAAKPGAVDARQLATAEGPNVVDLDFIYPNLIPAGAIAPPDKRASLALIVDGRYADAAERLTDSYGARPADAEAATLLGIALYLGGDDADRVGGLLQQGTALRRQDLQRYAQWFLANHYLRRGDVVKANEFLIELSQWPDSPGSKASALLERLGAEAR